MAKYNVSVSETYSKNYIVEADTEEKALMFAKEALRSGEITLVDDGDNFYCDDVTVVGIATDEDIDACEEIYG